ncbi:MAG: MBL fold metallo-hydrolase [Candidatus Zixiibacteriota bacterium]|nr:MAG: MBL fold metallo-hydrolase [candidate division Zixibacteria bacterium]
MRFGDFEINTFVEQRFKLDGGSMFGVIPRSLWGKMIPPDENNLIDMHTNLFVLKAHGKNFIFDTGLGDTLSDREKKVYTAPGISDIEKGLKGLGLTPDDIDYVVLTHLHTDHAGGSVKIEGGRFVPRFGQATYVASKDEWQSAMNPNERTSAVYAPDRYRALKDFSRVELLDANTELLPGIRAVFTGGHTRGHFALEMESGGAKVYYYADIFCTSHHMPVAYVPAVDLYPDETMAIKRDKLPEIIADGVVMAFDHDVSMPFGRVREDGRKLVVDKVEGELAA